MVNLYLCFFGCNITFHCFVVFDSLAQLHWGLTSWLSDCFSQQFYCFNFVLY